MSGLVFKLVFKENLWVFFWNGLKISIQSCLDYCLYQTVRNTFVFGKNAMKIYEYRRTHGIYNIEVASLTMPFCEVTRDSNL